MANKKNNLRLDVDGDDKNSEMKIAFGKHKGKKLRYIPSWYLDWMTKNITTDWAHRAAMELDRRKDAITDEFIEEKVQQEMEARKLLPRKERKPRKPRIRKVRTAS